MDFRKGMLAGFMFLVVMAVCIPATGAELRFTVTGRVDTATSNCEGWVGVGPAPGEGVAIKFGYYGAGCHTRGFLIDARGVLPDAQYPTCDALTGTWLWIEPGQSYTATLTILGNTEELSVPGVGVSTGTVENEGLFSVLYVGREGDGDWPSCSGAIDAVTVEIKEGNGDWILLSSEDFSSDAGFSSTDPDIYISGGQAHWTVYRNGGSQFLFRDLVPQFVGTDSRSWGGMKAIYR